MIQYHGTPIGGTRYDAIMALVGRHALVPWKSPQHLDVAMECCESFVIDNSAFSFWKGGGAIDPVAYVAWIEREGINKHPGFDWAIIPDVIDGNEADNDAMLADWDRSIRGVPVFHLHESLDRAERLSREWGTVALGSSGQWSEPGTREWWRRMNELREAFCDDGVPRCRLHGLRMLDPAIFTHLPLASADSTNIGRNGLRNGTAFDERFTRGQGSFLTAMRLANHNSVRTWEVKPVEQLSATLFDS